MMVTHVKFRSEGFCDRSTTNEDKNQFKTLNLAKNVNEYERIAYDCVDIQLELNVFNR